MVETKQIHDLAGRPGSMIESNLQALKNGPMSKSEIARYLGQKKISGSLKKALAELLKEEKITYTIPEKPNNRFQKYKLN